jgi:putative PIN family toxin of toxin-antitoxin system
MANEMRIVVDSGVAVSAVLLPRSIPRQAFDAAASHGQLLVSVATIAELDEVLRRPKFDKYVSVAQRVEFLAALVRQAEEIEVVDTVTDCVDPKDNKFLEVALSGRATHILASDQDLVAMHAYRGIAIVRPQDFLDALRITPKPEK